MSPRSTPLPGTLELLILKALSLDPLHGVGLMQRIEQITAGAMRVSYGSLFPAVRRMEEKRWLTAEWRPSENNRRARYYALTRTGRKQLQLAEDEWGRMVAAVSAALRTT